MKFVINRLKKGDQIVAEIVECVSAQEFIVSFQGDLLRVANQSGRDFAEGRKVTLQVTSVDPLSFQVAAIPKRGFDISI